MPHKEDDDKPAILTEIRRIENELAGLSSDMYDISMKRKFLHHRLADLKYDLNHESE